MSINVEISQKDLKDDNKVKVQYLPASIDGNGVMKVDEYFNNYTVEDSHGKNVNYPINYYNYHSYLIYILVLKNSLRGYPLQGCKKSIPSGLKGIVLTESKKLTTENTDRDLQLSGHFDEFTYWNYDKIPSKNDPYEKAHQWMEISDTVRIH